MAFPDPLAAERAVARPLDALRPWLLLATRLYVGWQFLKSGWLKLVVLGHDARTVPGGVSRAAAAARVGRGRRHGGRTGVSRPAVPRPRLAPLGARPFAVNVLAVVSYAHVLLAEGFEAALGQHLLWGFMLAVRDGLRPGRAQPRRRARRAASRRVSGGEAQLLRP